MNYRSIMRSVILGSLTVIFTVASPVTSRGDSVVAQGWDLFETVPEGTKINLGPAGIQPFKGVPLETFNFTMGPVATFSTDTIVRRLADATSGVPIPIRMVALQLMSVNQFDLGAGNGFHFVTLQSATPSDGEMTIIFGPEVPPGMPHGTFTAFLDVHFDIRFGALDGPIVLSDWKRITLSATDWSHFPPGEEVLLIPGVNYLLFGQGQSRDFFTQDLAMHQNPDGSMHTVRPATVPEPATMILLGTGLVGIVAGVRRRRRN